MSVYTVFCSYRNAESLEKNLKNCQEEISEINTEFQEVVKAVGLHIECHISCQLSF
jgi:DNA-binding protein YbaB